MSKIKLITFSVIFSLSLITYKSALAATITVDTFDQEGVYYGGTLSSPALNSNGSCSLAEAIHAANTDTAFDSCAAGNGADVIVLQNAGTYDLSYPQLNPGMYVPNTNQQTLITGYPAITSDITINGATNDEEDTIIQKDPQATYTCSAGCLLVAGSDYSFTSSLTLNHLTVKGTRVYSIITTSSGATATINNSTISDNTSGGNGVIANQGTMNMTGVTVTNNNPFDPTSGVGGGGIMTNGTMQITNSTISNNFTNQYGGGIFHSGGTLTLSNSLVTGNSAGGVSQQFKGGGGIYLGHPNAVLNIQNSIISNNQSTQGGGIYAQTGTLNITNSTITNNTVLDQTQAHGGGIKVDQVSLTLDSSSITDNLATSPGGGEAFGGGVFVQGLSNNFVNNSTIANNTATSNGGLSQGGGFWDQAQSTNNYIQLNYTTVAENNADQGSGLYHNELGSPGLNTNTLRIVNSIIDDNTASGSVQNDCEGPINSLGYNIIGDTSNCTITQATGDQFDVSADLGTFYDSGVAGYAFFPLLDTSPAIDAGDTNCTANDQVGQTRLNLCDVGSIENACGDGTLVSGAESCDDGNLINEDGCNDVCENEICGDSVTQSGLGEECDDGNSTNDDGCDNNCTNTACGNSIVTSGEQCDDGNTTNNDGCDENCVFESTCGDGTLEGLEACDDGNLDDDDGCDSNCTATACGNSIVTSGEDCDDGNLANEDGCDSSCLDEFCGDGVTQAGLNEACDDGNIVSEDGCSDTCLLESCGDGVHQAGLGEYSDDGNKVSIDWCDNLCQTEFCGDSIIQIGLGETCDDGNTVSNDGCDSNCTATACGNAIVTSGEQCDDGNLTSGDGCSETCQTETPSNTEDNTPVPTSVEFEEENDDSAENKSEDEDGDDGNEVPVETAPPSDGSALGPAAGCSLTTSTGRLYNNVFILIIAQLLLLLYCLRQNKSLQAKARQGSCPDLAQKQKTGTPASPKKGH